MISFLDLAPGMRSSARYMEARASKSFSASFCSMHGPCIDIYRIPKYSVARAIFSVQRRACHMHISISSTRIRMV